VTLHRTTIYALVRILPRLAPEDAMTAQATRPDRVPELM
jgi:hypothetical protein